MDRFRYKIVISSLLSIYIRKCAPSFPFLNHFLGADPRVKPDFASHAHLLKHRLQHLGRKTIISQFFRGIWSKFPCYQQNFIVLDRRRFYDMRFIFFHGRILGVTPRKHCQNNKKNDSRLLPHLHDPPP